MVPMFEAKAEELTVEKKRLRTVREELTAFQEENGIKLRYVQPMLTTHFMNRKTSTRDGERVKPVDYQSLNKKLIRDGTIG